MRRTVLLCLSAALIASVASPAFAWRGGYGGGYYRGPMGAEAYRGPAGGAAVRGPEGGVAIRRPDGGAVYRGPEGGTAYRAPSYVTVMPRPGVAAAAGVAVGATASGFRPPPYYALPNVISP